MKYPTYKLGDILSYEQPTNYIVESTEYDGSYPTPVLTAGKSFILGYTNETKGVYDKLPVIIFDDFTTASQFVDFKFKVKSSAMKILSCNEEIADIKYMYYLMQITHIQSDTHKRYWISDYSKIPVSLPPLTTQHAIVSRIESLFAELDKAEEHLRTAQQQLKIYRQAVLNHWLNNEDGKWEMVKLGDVIDKPTYGTSKKCDYEIAGTGVLRIPNIGDGYIIEDDLKFALFSEEEKKKYSLKEGDLLTIRSNGSVDLVGKCALISCNEEKYLFAGYLIRLRPIKEKTVPKFLLFALESHKLRVQIEEKAKSTSGVNNINSVEIQHLQIPLPALPEQQRIVKEIESRLSQTEATEARIAESLQQTEALRQSILKKAFSGELV